MLGAGRRRRVLLGTVLLLALGNVIHFGAGYAASNDVYPGSEEWLWFGYGDKPLQSMSQDFPMIDQPLVRLNALGATRAGRPVPYTDMVDNMGMAAFGRKLENCADYCPSRPWVAFAVADPAATMAGIMSAVRSVRERCNVEVIIFDEINAETLGRAMFLAPVKDVARLTGDAMWPEDVQDPTLIYQMPNETQSDFLARTGCNQLNPLRS